MASRAKSIKLAKALTGLSSQLVDLGRLEEALRAMQKAVELYRSLAQDNPGEHLSDLACSLNALSERLFAMNNTEGAIAAAEEAIELEQQRLHDGSTECTINLASSFDNCAKFHAKNQDPLRALPQALGALLCYRALSASQKDLTEKTADCLFHLSGLMYLTGTYGRGERQADNAISVYNQLAEGNPKKFSLAFLKSFDLRGLHLSGLGHYQMATSTAEKLVDMICRLVPEHPWILIDTPTFLVNYSSHLSHMGDHKRALEVSHDVMKRAGHLSANHSAAFTPHLAMALNNASGQLSQLGLHFPALLYGQEAVRLFRQLVIENSVTHIPHLICSLNNLSNHLCNVGQKTEALETIREAIQLLPQPTAVNTRALPWVTDLLRVKLLGTLCEHQLNMNYHDEALHSINEAINLDRQYVATNPRVFEPVLARHFQNLAFCLIQSGRANEALVPLDEALTLCQSLINSLPLVFSNFRDNCAHMRSYCTLNSQQIEENVTNGEDKTM